MSLLARLKPSSPPAAPPPGSSHDDPDLDPFYITSTGTPPPAGDAPPPPPPPPKDPYLLDPAFRVRPSTSNAASPVSQPQPGQAFYFPPTTPLTPGGNGLVSQRPSTAAADLQRDREREGGTMMQFNVPFSQPTRGQFQSHSPATPGGPSRQQRANSPSSSSFDADETGSTLASIPSSSNSSSYPAGMHQNGNGNGTASQLDVSGDTVRPFEKVSGGRADGPTVTFAALATPPKRQDSLSLRQALKGKPRAPGERFNIASAIGSIGSLTKRAGALAPVRRATTASESTSPAVPSQSAGNGNVSPPLTSGPGPSPQTAPAAVSGFKKAFFLHRPHTPSTSSGSQFPASPGGSTSPVSADIYPPEPSDGDPSISLPFHIEHNIHVDEGFSGLPPTWTTKLPEAGFSEGEIAMMRAKGRTGPVEPKTLFGRETPKMGGLYGAVPLADRSGDGEMERMEDRMNRGMASIRAAGGTAGHVGGMGIGLGPGPMSSASLSRIESAPDAEGGSQTTLGPTAPLQPRRAPSPLPPNGVLGERRTATPPRRPPPAGPLPAPPPKEPEPARIRVLPEPPVRLLPTPPGPGEWPDDLETPSEEVRRLADEHEEYELDEGGEGGRVREGEVVDQERMTRELEQEELETPELDGHHRHREEQEQRRPSVDTASASASASQHTSSSSHLSPAHETQHPLRASVVPPLPPVISLPELQLPLSLGLGLQTSEISWGEDWAGDIFASMGERSSAPAAAPTSPPKPKQPARLDIPGPSMVPPSKQSASPQQQKPTRTPVQESARTSPSERTRRELEKERDDEVKQLAEMAPWLLVQTPSTASPSGTLMPSEPVSPPPPVPEKDLPRVPHVNIQPPTQPPSAISPTSSGLLDTPTAPTPTAFLPPTLSPMSAQAQLPTIREIQVRQIHAVPTSPSHSVMETDAGFLSDRSDSGFSLANPAPSRGRAEANVPPVPPLPPIPQVQKATVEDDAEGQVLTVPPSPNPSITAASGSPALRTPETDDEFDPTAYADMSPRGSSAGQQTPAMSSPAMPTPVMKPHTSPLVTSTVMNAQSPVLQSPIIQQLQRGTASPRTPATERPLPAAPTQLMMPMTPPRTFSPTSPTSQMSSALPSSTIFPSHLVTSPTMTPNSVNGYPLQTSSPRTSDGGYTFTLAPGSGLPSRANSLQASPGGPAVRFPQTPMDVRDRFPRSPGGETQIEDELEEELDTSRAIPPPQRAVVTNGNAEEVEEGGIGDALKDWLENEAEDGEDEEERRSQALPEGYRPLAPYLLSGSPPPPKTLTLIALGTHSHIYTASPLSPIHVQTQHLAYKYIPRPTLSTLRETLLQLSLRHAHLLGADGAWLRPQSQIEGMEAEEAVQESMMKGWEMWVRMERMERSLAEVCVLSGEGLDLGGETVVARLMADVLAALSYLHSRGVVHRDVRSDNLLFSTDGRLLLADFFHAVQLTDERPTRDEVVGVWYWMAPELRAGQPYNTAVDIYSLGATLWELLEGVPPHSEIEDVEYLRTIRHLPPLSQPMRWSEQLRSFLAMCAEDPSRRPSAAALLDTPFIRRACSRAEVVALLNRARLLEDELHRQEAAAATI